MNNFQSASSFEEDLNRAKSSLEIRQKEIEVFLKESLINRDIQYFISLLRRYKNYICSNHSQWKFSKCFCAPQDNFEIISISDHDIVLSKLKEYMPNFDFKISVLTPEDLKNRQEITTYFDFESMSENFILFEFVYLG